MTLRAIRARRAVAPLALAAGLASTGLLLAAPAAPSSGPRGPVGQTAPDASTASGTAPTLATDLRVPTEQYRLSNGLTVILSRDTSLPVVAVEVRYLVGSSYERKGLTGFAHLFEHLMFQGSAHHDREYFEPFEPIGADVNGTTSQDRTNYYERVPANYLETALWMESDRMDGLLPVLTQEKLENQIAVVINERRQRYENQPYGLAWELISAALYPEGHPYHHTAIGSPEDVAAATLADVRAFFQQYYVPANAMLTIVGDFEVEPTKAMIERYFGAIPGGHRAARPSPEPVELTSVVKVASTDKVKLPRIYLVWPTPPLYEPGDAELDLLSSVLASGKASRLYKRLVYDKRIASDVSAFQSSSQLGSEFVVQVTAAEKVSVETLADEVRAALAEALATPPTDTELRRAKRDFEKGFFHRLEDVISRAELLCTYVQHRGTPDYIQADLARYADADPAAVMAAGQRWLPPDRVVELTIVPGVDAGGAK